MGKIYTLEDNDGLMSELKSMRGKMAEMRDRLERDEITPDDWRAWHAGYSARFEELRQMISAMREELSRRDAELLRLKLERASELNMTPEEYDSYIKTLANNELH